MMPPKVGRAAPKPEPQQTDRKAPPSLPSVWDLGLIAERFRTMARNIDATPAEDRSVASAHRPELDKQAALCVARDREHATIDLLLTLPAQSLHDAAVQIHHSAFLLDQIEVDDPAQSAVAVRMLRTVLASIGAAVLDHAGLDFIGSGIDFTDTLDAWTNLHIEASKPPV
jgi:hypothetical protein